MKNAAFNQEVKNRTSINDDMVLIDSTVYGSSPIASMTANGECCANGELDSHGMHFVAYLCIRQQLQIRISALFQPAF